MAKVSSNGKMKVNMLENLRKACFMVKAIISGKMGENFKEHTKMGL